MLGRLFLLFTLVPLVELYLLITIGGLMGAGPTIALIAVTGMIGAWLARREGRRALESYQAAMSKGQLPEDGIVSGLLILAGGVMLITPGVLTDICGLALMVPPLRRAVARVVKRRFAARITSGEVKFSVSHLGPPGAGGFGPFAEPFMNPDGVVDVEVVDSQPRSQPSASSSGDAPLERRR